MKYSSKSVEKLVENYKEISLLSKIGGLLSWDMEVNLPQKGVSTRSLQSAYVAKLTSSKWLESDFRKLIEKVNKEKGLSREERAIVRNINQAAKYYLKVPQEIIVEAAETSSKAFASWREAREKNKFKIFSEDLKKVISLSQIVAKHMGYKTNPYDALLDVYEPGLTAEECEQIFTPLVKDLTVLVKKIKKSKHYKFNSGLMEKNYDIGSQKQIADFVLKMIGYDFGAGRMDISAHPFTTELGDQDIRITNRYSANNFVESIMVALHEGGHALYEQGINEEYALTPLEGGVSLGIHESQSRFWENQVGRSREFIEYIEPILNAFYPGQIADIDREILYRQFNRVNPSFIRVEADEVTYNLHIALRFEMENMLINEKVKVDDLPTEWNRRMKKYLGIVSERDSDGVLQDVHWSHGLFGYFPTYTLGNLYAAQFTNKLKTELDFDELRRGGEFGTILSWLRSNIHKYGSLYYPGELVKKVTGEALTANYFTDYVNEKYSALYSL